MGLAGKITIAGGGKLALRNRVALAIFVNPDSLPSSGG